MLTVGLTSDPGVGVGVVWAYLIILIALSVLTASAYGLYRRPRWLSETGRGPRLAVIVGAPVLILYLIGRPVLAGMVMGTGLVSSPQQTIESMAVWIWLGFAFSLPAILVWWLGSRLAIGSDPSAPLRLSAPLREMIPRRGAVRRRGEEDAPESRLEPRSLTISLAASVAFLLLVWPVVWVTLMIGAWARVLLTGKPSDPIAHEVLRLIAETPMNISSVALIAGVILTAPLVEEVIYRGALQAMLREYLPSPWAAIALTSLVFAVQHAGVAAPESLPALFILSVVFGLAYEWTGRLAAPMLMHAIFNAGNVVLAM